MVLYLINLKRYFTFLKFRASQSAGKATSAKFRYVSLGSTRIYIWCLYRLYSLVERYFLAVSFSFSNTRLHVKKDIRKLRRRHPCPLRTKALFGARHAGEAYLQGRSPAYDGYTLSIPRNRGVSPLLNPAR